MKNLVQYLAALAPRPATRGTAHVRRKRDLLMLRDVAVRMRRRPTDREHPFPLQILHNDDRIERFAKLDALSPDEHLLRLGFLWLSGKSETPAGTLQYLMPVMSAVVAVHGFVQGMNEIELIEDFEIADELGSPESRDLVEDDARELMLDLLVFEHGDRQGRLAAFTDHIQTTLDLPPLTVAAPGLHPTALASESGLYMTAGLGLYPARDIEKITVGSTIAAWAASDLAATAFASMYHDTGAAPRLPDAAVKSPALLNREQRRAVGAARSQPVTVISGPPGTGKTHTVAALALDEVALGRSVLIATQSDHAARVVTQHLGRMNVREYVRFGHEQGRAAAAEQLAAGVARPSRLELRRRRERFEAARHEHQAITDSIVAQLEYEEAAVARLQGSAAPLPRLSRIGELDDATLGVIQRRLQGLEETPSWLAGLRSRRIGRRLGAPRDAAAAAIHAAVTAHRATLRVGTASSSGREDWDALAAAAGRARRRLLREADPARVLDVMPMWIGTLNEIDDILRRCRACSTSSFSMKRARSTR